MQHDCCILTVVVTAACVQATALLRYPLPPPLDKAKLALSLQLTSFLHSILRTKVQLVESRPLVLEAEAAGSVVDFIKKV